MNTFTIPTKLSQLPTTREGYEALAGKINAAGGLGGRPIIAYKASCVTNIRKNFMKRLGIPSRLTRPPPAPVASVSRIAALEAENAALKETIAALKETVAVLRTALRSMP
jgi:hypothetical protein